MLNRVFGSPNRQQQEWLLLSSACLLKLVAGQQVAGPVYANYMRSAFALKQSELGIAMTLQCCGTLFMFVSGLVHDRWGPRVAVAVGGVATTFASLAVTLTFAFPAQLRGHPWVLWLLFFVYGHTFNYGEVAAMAAAMCCFRPDRRGRVMSILDNFFNLGAPLSALVHYLVFGNLHRPPDSQNAVGAMAVQTGLIACVYAFALVFIYQPDLQGGYLGLASVEMGERTPILGREAQLAAPLGQIQEEEEEEEEQEMKLERQEAATRSQTAGEFLQATCTAIFTGPYLLLLATFALGLGQYLAVWLNVTTVTRSLGLSGEDMKYFWVPTLFSIAWRCILGPVSDRFCSESYKRATALLVCMGALGTPALLLITVPMRPGAVSPLGVTLSSYILSALFIASLFTLGPVLLSQTNPQPVFGRLFSICMMAGTALSLPLSLQSGLQYDRRATVVNGTATCTGQECYLYGNIANSACHLASMLFLLGLVLLLRVSSRT